MGSSGTRKGPERRSPEPFRLNRNGLVDKTDRPLATTVEVVGAIEIEVVFVVAVVVVVVEVGVVVCIEDLALAIVVTHDHVVPVAALAEVAVVVAIAGPACKASIPTRTVAIARTSLMRLMASYLLLIKGIVLRVLIRSSCANGSTAVSVIIDPADSAESKWSSRTSAVRCSYQLLGFTCLSPAIGSMFLADAVRVIIRAICEPAIGNSP